MNYLIAYENGKVVFIIQLKDYNLILMAKYIRTETLGM